MKIITWHELVKPLYQLGVGIEFNGKERYLLFHIFFRLKDWALPLRISEKYVQILCMGVSWLTGWLNNEIVRSKIDCGKKWQN